MTLLFHWFSSITATKARKIVTRIIWGKKSYTNGFFSLLSIYYEKCSKNVVIQHLAQSLLFASNRKMDPSWKYKIFFVEFVNFLWNNLQKCCHLTPGSIVSISFESKNGCIVKIQIFLSSLSIFYEKNVQKCCHLTPTPIASICFESKNGPIVKIQKNVVKFFDFSCKMFQKCCHLTHAPIASICFELKNGSIVKIQKNFVDFVHFLWKMLQKCCHLTPCSIDKTFYDSKNATIVKIQHFPSILTTGLWQRAQSTYFFILLFLVRVEELRLLSRSKYLPLLLLLLFDLFQPQNVITNNNRIDKSCYCHWRIRIAGSSIIPCRRQANPFSRY